MDLPTAGKLAHDLLAEHGLTRRGWTFAFNRARRQLGKCDYTKQRIELSSPFVARNDEAEVRDTILHEIAHALAGHRAGHGPKWRAMCEKLGARPKRTCETATMPHGAYRAVCPSCRMEHHRHRRPLKGRTYFCRQCGSEDGRLRFAQSGSR